MLFRSGDERWRRGDIIARWDKGNREPSYPSSAELKGLQGTVRVKIDLDEKGNVTNFIMEKGSGVPEINSAIESIGRTWKIRKCAKFPVKENIDEGQHLAREDKVKVRGEDGR